MNAPPRGTIRYDIGLNYWDFLRYNMMIATISVLVFFLMIAFMMVPLTLLAMTDPYETIVMCCFIDAMLLFIVLFTFGIIALRSLIHSSWMRGTCSNYVEMREHDIVIHSQQAILYPEIVNIVPLLLMDKAGPVPDWYVRERWKNTPWWMKMNFLHKIPHGGLYNPITSRKNLLLITLKEPVMISNRDLSHFFLQRAIKYDSKPVMELVLDIDKEYHDHFIRELHLRKGP